MKLSYSILVSAGLLFSGCHHRGGDPAAIKKVLETESATWRSGDIKAHAACWKIQPYSRVLVSAADGSVFDVSPARMTDPATPMGHGGSSQNSNYQMNVNGKTAWVSHNEVSTAVDGTKTYSYEIKLLEKDEGEWKLVGESIHLYKPK